MLQERPVLCALAEDERLMRVMKGAICAALHDNDPPATLMHACAALGAFCCAPSDVRKAVLSGLVNFHDGDSITELEMETMQVAALMDGALAHPAMTALLAAAPGSLGCLPPSPVIVRVLLAFKRNAHEVDGRRASIAAPCHAWLDVHVASK